MTAEHRVRGAGIGSAGPVHLPTGTVSPINLTAWRDFPIRDRVAAALPGLPVRLGGDAVRAWPSVSTGAVPGRVVAFLLGMVVSTGVGGGLVFDGAPYDGRTGNAGHVGHVVVDTDGPPCHVRRTRLRGGDRRRSPDDAVGARQRLGRAAGGQRQGVGCRRGRRGRGGAAGLRARSDRGRGDDRVGGRGVRPGPGDHRRWCGEIRRPAVRPAAGRAHPVRQPGLHHGHESGAGAVLGGDAGLVGAAALLRHAV